MLSYVVLIGKHGQPVDPNLLEHMGHDDLAELAFVPEQSVHWFNPQRTVHFLGWQAFPEINGVYSHWHIDEDVLTAFSGHVWPRETGWDWGNGSWASQLARYYRTHGVRESVEDLHGVFTAVHCREKAKVSS